MTAHTHARRSYFLSLFIGVAVLLSSRDDVMSAYSMDMRVYPENENTGLSADDVVRQPQRRGLRLSGNRLLERVSAVYHGIRNHLPIRRRQSTRVVQPYSVVYGYTPPTTSPLFKSIKNGNIAEIGHIIKSCQSWPEEEDELGNTVLHVAAINGHNEVVSLIIEEYGPYVTRCNPPRRIPRTVQAFVRRINNDGDTALMVASLHGHTDIVTTLLKDGASVNVGNRDKRFAIHLAASRGHNSVIAQLVEHGADVYSRDKHGFVPLHLAVMYGHISAIEALLEVETSIPVLTQMRMVDSQENAPIDMILISKGKHIVEGIEEKLSDITPNLDPKWDEISLADVTSTPLFSMYDFATMSTLFAATVYDLPLSANVLNHRIIVQWQLPDIHAQPRHWAPVHHIGIFPQYKKPFRGHVYRYTGFTTGLPEIYIDDSAKHEKLLGFINSLQREALDPTGPFRHWQITLKKKHDRVEINDGLLIQLYSVEQVSKYDPKSKRWAGYWEPDVVEGVVVGEVKGSE